MLDQRKKVGPEQERDAKKRGRRRDRAPSGSTQGGTGERDKAVELRARKGTCGEKETPGKRGGVRGGRNLKEKPATRRWSGPSAIIRY